MATSAPRKTRINFPSIDAGLAYRETLTATDLAKVRALLAAMGATACYTPAVNDYVAFTHKGRVVAYLHPGFITILDRSGIEIDRDLAKGRPMTKNSENGKGWDLYLDGWEGPGNDETRTPGEKGKVTPKPKKRKPGAQERDYCAEDGCFAHMVHFNQVYCRRHALAA